MKKIKLFLSLSMLCLSIAVLCFGVFAATSVTYTISGTISYDITDVFAKINTKVFKVAGVQDVTTMQTNVDTLATMTLTSIANGTYIDSGIGIDEYDTENGGNESRTLNVTMDNTYMTYYVVVNIENLATKKINAQLTDTTTYTNLNTASKLIKNNIAKGETKNLVVAFSIADKTKSTNVSVNYSVEVGYTKYGSVPFRVDGTSYNCFEGETWREFVERGGLGEEVYVNSYDGENGGDRLASKKWANEKVPELNGETIGLDEEIVEGAEYSWANRGGLSI